jgi:hypothetical protein
MEATPIDLLEETVEGKLSNESGLIKVEGSTSTSRGDYLD